MEPERERIMTPEEARRDHREMLRYLAVNALYGLATGATVAGVLIWLNIGAVRVTMMNGRPIRTKYGSHMPTW